MAEAESSDRVTGMNRRILLALAISLAALVVVVPAASARLIFFQSPTHNIGCVMSGKFVRCDIRHHSWPTPPKPPTCDVDYGEGVAVGRHGPATYVCAGDTAFDPKADVLEYGQRARVKRMRCTSKSNGMRCVNRETKHGFFLSADDVRLF
jgi:hypothetical protein